MGMREMWENGSGNGGDFEVLPEGIYDCETYDLTHQAGNDGIMRTEITFNIIAGIHEGRRIWLKVKHAQNQVFMMRLVWDASGLNGSPFDGLGEDASDEEVWNNWGRLVYETLGSEMRVKVAHRKWTGQDGQERTSLSVKDLQQLKRSESSADEAGVPW